VTHYGAVPPPEVWLRFHPYYRALALRAIEMAGGIRHVYTVAAP